MQVDIRGRVAHTQLPKSKVLLPLFEAISNSIDSLQEAGNLRDNGQIRIKVKRQQIEAFPEPEQQLEGKAINPITGFEIKDNGIGFTEANYNSFNEVDSLYKIKKGGKGLGRFTWLKAFERVNIESVFLKDGNLFFRHFIFSLKTKDGISDDKIENAPKNIPFETTIKLEDLKNDFLSIIPKNLSTIAERIVEHFLSLYLIGDMPPIFIFEEDLSSEINLDSTYENLVYGKDIDNININGFDFEIQHFLLHAASGLDHHISYCGNNREVQTETLNGKISNLPSIIKNFESEEELIYAGYVSGSLFDKYNSSERIGFDFLPEEGLGIPGEPTFTEIKSKVIEKSKKFLEPFTKASREEKDQKIIDFVTNTAPEYRYIVSNHPEKLDSIPIDVTPEKLDTKLYEIQKEIESELREKAQELLNQDTDEPDEFEEKFSQFWSDYNEAGKANLSKYICQRRWVLNIFEKSLNLKETGKYPLEEIIHQIFFPLKKTSDDIEFEKHNLWMIDEKLAYHRYLASDLPFNQISKVNINSDNRPDLILFFDSAFVITNDEEPYTSGIVLFEFKRPMRDDYDQQKNPIEQIYNYIQLLKNGVTKTKEGRQLTIIENTPIYCYIIADLTPKLVNLAKLADYLPTPDNQGFFKYHTQLRAYSEIISYPKLLGDAKKRNRVLFEKLNLPSI